MAYPFIIGI